MQKWRTVSGIARGRSRVRAEVEVEPSASTEPSTGHPVWAASSQHTDVNPQAESEGTLWTVYQWRIPVNPYASRMIDDCSILDLELAMIWVPPFYWSSLLDIVIVFRQAIILMTDLFLILSMHVEHSCVRDGRVKAGLETVTIFVQDSSVGEKVR